MEAVGKPETWHWVVDMVRRGGTVNFFGGCPNESRVMFDTNLLHYSEITCKASFHHTPAYIRKALDLVARGDITSRDLRQQRGAAGQSAGSDAPPDEPQRPSEDGHYSVILLPPKEFVLSPEAAAARYTPSPKRKPTPAGWPRITTRISKWSVFCCPSACIRISTTSTPTAAGPTIWATKSGIASRKPAPAGLVARPARRHVRRRSDSPGFRGFARHGSPPRNSADSRLRNWSTRSNRTKPSPATPPGTTCTLTAANPPIPSDAWCCTSAAIPMRNASASPTPPAPPCNSPTSGRTWPWIWKRTASISRSKCWRATVTRWKTYSRAA